MLCVSPLAPEVDLTDFSLAHYAGVGINYISQLERVKETVELGRAMRVLQTLGLTSTQRKEVADEKSQRTAYRPRRDVPRRGDIGSTHLVGAVGLEPTFPKEADFKSAASANSATLPRRDIIRDLQALLLEMRYWRQALATSHDLAGWGVPKRPARSWLVTGADVMSPSLSTVGPDKSLVSPFLAQNPLPPCIKS